MELTPTEPTKRPGPHFAPISRSPAQAIEVYSERRRRHWEPIYTDDPGVVLIPLTQGKFALLDIGDLSLVRPHTWFASANPKDYAIACVKINGKKCRIGMHGLLLGLVQHPDLAVDHINGNSLDNRRSNLRPATVAENARNKTMPHHTSRFKGVTYNATRPRPAKWRAQIRFWGHLIHLGYFRTEVEAARAYNASARQYFGEYARLNLLSFPQEGEDAA